jgi:hypothetical protein
MSYLPPLLMRLKIINRDQRINLWLPLFLAWSLLFAFAVAHSPLVCVLSLVLWPFGWGETLLLLGPYIYRCLCATRDLKVDISKPGETVLIYFK